MTLPEMPGDYVAMTSAKVPDLTTGARGVTNRLYEVTNRKPNYAGARMGFDLLDTGLTGIAAAPVYGTGVYGTAKYF